MTTIQINKRGTLTLPKEFRKMLAESSEKGLLLKPALAFPIELYSDSRVAEFDEEDKALGRYLVGKKRKK